MEVEDVDSDSDSLADDDSVFNDSTCSESEEIDEMEEQCANKRVEEEHWLKLLLFLCTVGIIFKKEKKTRPKHSKKTLAERMAPWNFIATWTDHMFYRQFRMHRPDFFSLLQRMIDAFLGPHDSGPKNYEYSCQQGDNAWGCHIPLQIKLCVTLRILAGASYLDMIWYGCSVNHSIVLFC
jgi:hypothetical protein